MVTRQHHMRLAGTVPRSWVRRSRSLLQRGNLKVQKDGILLDGRIRKGVCRIWKATSSDAKADFGAPKTPSHPFPKTERQLTSLPFDGDSFSKKPLIPGDCGFKAAGSLTTTYTQTNKAPVKPYPHSLLIRFTSARPVLLLHLRTAFWKTQTRPA